MNLVVMISGQGSNLQAIIDACHAGMLKARIVLVVSDRATAYGIKRARGAHINTLIKKRALNLSIADYEYELVEAVSAAEPHFVILAVLPSLKLMKRIKSQIW